MGDQTYEDYIRRARIVINEGSIDDSVGGRLRITNGVAARSTPQSLRYLEYSYKLQAIMERTASSTDYKVKYAVDVETLRQMGLPDTEANVQNLRNAIRNEIVSISNNAGKLKEFRTRGTALGVKPGSTPGTFEFTMSDQPGYVQLTTGKILDFAYIDAADRGAQAAMANMGRAFPTIYDRLAPKRDTARFHGLLDACLSGSQGAVDPFLCYVGGLAKGDSLFQSVTRIHDGVVDPVAKGKVKGG